MLKTLALNFELRLGVLKRSVILQSKSIILQGTLVGHLKSVMLKSLCTYLKKMKIMHLSFSEVYFIFVVLSRVLVCKSFNLFSIFFDEITISNKNLIQLIIWLSNLIFSINHFYIADKVNKGIRSTNQTIFYDI